MEVNIANNSIDISDFVYKFKAHMQFGIGIIPHIVLNGDIKTILSFFKPIMPLFQEVNNGYMIKMLSETIILEIQQLLLRLGIVPKEVGPIHIIISEKDYNALNDLINGKGGVYGEPVKLTIANRHTIGMREFVKLDNAISINGVLAEELEVAKHDRGRVQKETA